MTDVRILCPGENWMNLGSLIAIGLNGYSSGLPAGSTVAPVTAVPLAKAVVEGPARVAAGDYDMAIMSPSWLVRMAREGRGPFPQPLPLRALACFPHDDQFVFAVREGVDATTLRDVVERRLPLKVAMPTPAMHHTVGWMVDAILAQHGCSRSDIEAWGGAIQDDHPPALNSPGAAAAPVDPSFDAVFDEAIMTLRWRRLTETYDLRFLRIDEQGLAACREAGMDAGILERGRLRGVLEDVPTIDASGWDLYCAEHMSDELAYLTAAAIDKQKDAISDRFAAPTSGLTSPVEMRDVCRDTAIPLHPGAEAYYREQGYLR